MRFGLGAFARVGIIVAGALLAACHGGGQTGSGGILPMAATGSIDHHAFHVVPFKASKKPISKSDGQNVYALFGWKSVPVGTGKANLTTFGAVSTNSFSGPMSQLAVVVSSSQNQHVYTNAQDNFAEFTDKATGDALITIYKSPTSTITYVCHGTKEIGIITETGHKKSAKPAHGVCPKSIATHDPIAPDVAFDSSSAPSKANVDYDICSLSSQAIPSAVDKLTFASGAKIDPALKPLVTAYKDLQKYLASTCKVGVALSPPANSPCETAGGAACTYASPPAPIMPTKAVCPQTNYTVQVTFGAPNQTCQIAVSYNVGTSGSYTVTNPNPAIVTVTPTSGTVSGAGSVNFTLVAGSAGGKVTVTVTFYSGSSVSNVAYFAVDNSWSTSATPAPDLFPYKLSSNSSPEAIAVGPDGALWFTEVENNVVGRVTTAGVVTEFPLPNAASYPWGITSGPDGALWFTESSAQTPRIGRITTAGVITEFNLTPGTSTPYNIVTGPDHNLWFADYSNSSIDSITTTGTVTMFPTTTSNSLPEGIVAGPDGNLWFTEEATGQVGRTSTTGTMTEFPLNAPGGIPVPVGITVGPDNNIWVSDESQSAQLFKVTTAGAITQYTSPQYLSSGITTGPDGAIWFTAASDFSPVGRVTTSGSFSTANFSVTLCPTGIVTGPDKNLWFVDPCSSTVDKVLPSATASISGGSKLRHRLQVPKQSKQ